MTHKHYTKAVFAHALMGCVDRRPPVVLDPAVGDGVLLSAAKDRWPEIKASGIDISADAIKQAIRQLPGAALRWADALSNTWPPRRSRDVALVVCNPPFTGCSCEPPDDRVDLKFLTRVLRYARPHDRVLFILPESIAANPSFSKVRSHLLATNRFLAAIRLPDNAFHNTEATAVAVLLQTGIPTAANHVHFIVLGRNARIVQRTTRAIDGKSHRFDPLFYVRQTMIPQISANVIPLGQLIDDVHRGVFVGKHDIRPKGYHRFIHSTHVDRGWIAIHNCGWVDKTKSGNVSPGSVLLSRVGACLWRKCALYNRRENATASDCVYIIKCAGDIRHSAYIACALTTRYSQACLRQNTQGITVPILNRSELLSVQVPYPSERLRHKFADLLLAATDASAVRAITRAFDAVLASR